VQTPDSPRAEVNSAIEAAEPEADAEHSTTPVELLWDLVFVFAVTQVATLLGHDLTLRGLGRAMLVLALIWWAWSAFVWATNAEDPDAMTFRVVLLLATALIFNVGVAVPQAFGREGTMFAATYALVRVLHLGLYVDASRRGNASLAAIAGFAVTVAIGMGLLLGGSFASGTLRVILWVAAAAIDYAGPAWLTRERLRGLQRVAVAHFAERYSMFIIICLGESIVSIGVGANGHALTAERAAAISFALLITIGLWWTYFDRLAAIAQERVAAHDDPVIAAADSYSYLHLILVAGIIIFAVGAKIAVAHVESPLSSAARLTVCGGVALYLIGHTAFRLRLLGTLSWPKLTAAGSCLAVIALTDGLPAWTTPGAVTLVLTLLVAWEMITERLDVALPDR
jgi:low temperature requirement protein LtrA